MASNNYSSDDSAYEIDSEDDTEAQLPLQSTLQSTLQLLNSDKYNMSHKKAGKCVIINNENFKKYSRRDGTDKDVEALQKFFNDCVHFEVVTHTDRTRAEIRQIMNQLYRDDFTDYGCLVCCVLTHGKDDKLVASDDKTYLFDNCYKLFNPVNCATLALKPKIFIIQACRGYKSDSGADVEVEITDNSSLIHSDYDERTDVTDGGSTTKIVKIPIHADFLIAYSNMKGYYSYRDKRRGSLFIQDLVTQLIKNYRNDDLVTILTTTMRIIALHRTTKNSDNTDIDSKKQIPVFQSTLIRKVYFKNYFQEYIKNQTD